MFWESKSLPHFWALVWMGFGVSLTLCTGHPNNEHPYISIFLGMDGLMSWRQQQLTGSILIRQPTSICRKCEAKLIWDPAISGGNGRWQTPGQNLRYMTMDESINGRYRVRKYKTLVTFHLEVQTSEISISKVNSQSKAWTLLSSCLIWRRH